MAQEQTTSQDLADLLATKNFDVEYKNAQGMDAPMNDATTFSFDYKSSNGTNYGTVVILLSDDSEVMLFSNDKLGKTMEDPEDKKEWFNFIQHISDFATRHNFNTFTPLNINQLKHTMQGMAAIKEGLFEGYYGTRKVSYMGEQTDARLVIKHNRLIGENDKRYRYVESLFIETVDGERFKLPFTKLAGGRAMLEHVRQGGKPYDIRGSHICEMVEEMSVLSRFNRVSQGRVFEGVTQELVEVAQSYYYEVKENLQHISSGRGYRDYFESWSPADIGDEDMLIEDLKQLFIEQTLDARIEAALPTLAKLQKQGAKMKEAEIFENWANQVMEGTWALPDTPEAQQKLNELMSKELIVGPDATNATEQLYDVVGDDQLFDTLQELAARDPRANIWEDTDVQRRLAELGIQTPQSTQAEPGDVRQDTAPAQPAPVNEGVLNDDTGNTWDHLLDRFRHEVEQFKQGDELDNDLYDALFDYYMQHGAMPYGVAKARTGDPHNWVTQRFADDLGLAEGDNLATFETMAAITGHGTTEVKEGSCNMTAEGEYCPEHGLAECGGMYEMGTVAGGMAPTSMPLEGKDDPINYNAAITGSYNESKDDPLARIKSLALSK